MQQAVDAQDAAQKLRAEILVAAGPHGDEGEGAWRVEAQRNGHLEDQDLAALVVGEREQSGVRFVRRVHGDLLFGETQAQQLSFQELHALAGRVGLHEHERGQGNLDIGQQLLQRAVRGDAVAQGGALEIDQRALVRLHEIGGALDAGLDEAGIHGLGAADADALQFGDLHGLLEILHIGVVGRGRDQNGVFGLQDLAEEFRGQRVLAETVVRLVDHHADAQSLIAQRFDQGVDGGVAVALLAHVALVLDARGHGLPGGDKDIAAAAAGGGAVVRQLAQAQAVELLAQEGGGLADHAFEGGEPEPHDIVDPGEALHDGPGHERLAGTGRGLDEEVAVVVDRGGTARGVGTGGVQQRFGGGEELDAAGDGLFLESSE